MEELRLAGYFDLNDIEYAILENNGQLSFLTSQSSSGGGSCYTSCSSNTQPLSSTSTNSSSQNTFSSNDNASKNKTLSDKILCSTARTFYGGFRRLVGAFVPRNGTDKGNGGGFN